MSKSAVPGPIGEILERLVPEIQKASGIPAEGLQRAAFEARVGKILEGEEVYVLYADVLGFKAQLEADPADLETRLERALLQVNFALQARIPGGVRKYPDGKTEQDPIVGLTAVNPASIFSDSIFVVSHGSTLEGLRQIAHMASTAFFHFFSEELPLRGAIAKGSVWWNRNTDVRLGPGITTAYELAEKLDVLGVAIAPGIELPENADDSVPFAIKGDDPQPATTPLGVPLQLSRNSLPMCYPRNFLEQFDGFAAKPENRATEKLRRRYETSRPVMEAMSAEPVPA